MTPVALGGMLGGALVTVLVLVESCLYAYRFFRGAMVNYD